MRIFILLFLTLASVRATIISSDRRVTWTPGTTVGVTGGIPNRTTIFCNVKVSIPGSTNVAVGDGIVDDYAAIYDAINLCPSNQVVYVPAGNYKLTQRVYFPTKSYFTLRGAGPAQTVFKSALSDDTKEQFLFGTSEWIPTDKSTTISGSPAKGATSITVASATGITTGMLVQIDQLNDDTYVTALGSGGFATSYDDTHDGTKNLQQIVRVTGVSGTTINFEPPLAETYSAAHSPRATRLIFTARKIGLEDFKIENVGTNKFHIFMDTCEDSWVKNVESSLVNHWDFWMYQCFNCEIRECYIHEAAQYTVGAGYGLEVQYCTGLLVENNVFRKLHDALIMAAGSTYCVIGYNLMYESFYDDAQPDWQIGAMNGGHGAHPTMNLYEGNIANRYQSDFYWGSSGPQTVFRNFLHGTDPGVTQNRICVSVDSHAFSNNIVGNILGFPGITWDQDMNTTNGYSPSRNAIYRIGYPGIGNNFYGTTSSTPATNDLDLRVVSSVLRHGNFDYAGNTQVWDGAIADHALSDSLYLSEKPSWFGSLAWPPFNPASPSTNFTAIPAGYLYFNGTPADPTAPTISPITSRSIIMDTSTGALAFTVGDSVDPASSLTVGVTSSNHTLADDADCVLGGSGSSRTVTITPNTGQAGITTITLIVTNLSLLTATNTFTLTVGSPAPVVTGSGKIRGRGKLK